MKLEEVKNSDLCLELARRFYSDDRELDEEQEKKLFESLKHVEGIQEYLRDTLAKDMRRYFAAGTDDERAIVRGAFARTSYWLGKLAK